MYTVKPQRRRLTKVKISGTGTVVAWLQIQSEEDAGCFTRHKTERDGNKWFVYMPHRKGKGIN